MTKQITDIIKAGLCSGCGACVLLDSTREAKMVSTSDGPIPQFTDNSDLPQSAELVCPSIGISYPQLYESHYKRLPDNWLLGNVEQVRTGFSSNSTTRSNGASGGILTETLIYLLEENYVDAVIVAKQGVPTPLEARAVVVDTKTEILEAAQSVYIPVSMLDIIDRLEEGKRYAITCLPEQSAALRMLQKLDHPQAKQILFVLGPYTGTALSPLAIDCFLKSKGVRDLTKVTSLKWRAGDWPGYLEIKTSDGTVIQTPKVYYNFLIPFFITQNSLQSMDFVNEFADLAVGDAWSPAFEKQGGGHSVIATRSKDMEKIITDMIEKKHITVENISPQKAADMHGHMLDFKKRGGWIRNEWRRKSGKLAPNYGYGPANINLSRYFVEIIISTIFTIGRSKLARWMVRKIPESILGPLFNNSRLFWKKISKPSKRKGLAEFKVNIYE